MAARSTWPTQPGGDDPSRGRGWRRRRYLRPQAFRGSSVAFRGGMNQRRHARSTHRVDGAPYDSIAAVGPGDQISGDTPLRRCRGQVTATAGTGPTLQACRSNRTTGISRFVFSSYSLKTGMRSFCVSQIPSRSAPPVTRAATGTRCLPEQRGCLDLEGPLPGGGREHHLRQSADDLRQRRRRSRRGPERARRR